MITFLLWPVAADEKRPPSEVATRFAAEFAGLFADAPEVRVRSTPRAHLAFLDRPVRGWLPPFFQEDDAGWVLAPDYPLNARAVLTARGITHDERDVLLKLARALQDDPKPLLRELAPPFSLVWSDAETGAVRFQNDGLGQAQSFLHGGEGGWALTNRVFALRALDVPLEPVTSEWATRLTLGWFPRTSTGYSGVRFLGPGTRLRAGEELEETTHDVLTEWVNPAPRSREDCLELALESLLALARENGALWESASAGLSGGWDSRAVVASLRAVGAEISPRVRGNPERYDVMIATKLAEIAGFRIRVKTSSGGPPAELERCRQSIASALRWQAGAMPTLKHKTFLGRKDRLDVGVVNVMGQHGGLGKADFVVKIGAHDLAPEQYEERLLDELLKDAPPFLRDELREGVREETRAAYRQADDYGLEGLQRLHFFYLFEYTRRWSSGALSAQPGLVYAPYLNPDFIRACFAYPAEELTARPLHRHITGTLAPEWADVPYSDRVTEEHLRSGLLRPAKVKKRKRREIRRTEWLRKRSHRKYSYRIYWEQVGAPLVREALDAGGFWTTIFDRERASEAWGAAPDPLAIAHLLPGVLAGE